jgi:hypothetical protein
MSDPFTRHRAEPDQPKAANEQPISADPQKPLDDQSNSTAAVSPAPAVSASNPFGHLKVEPKIHLKPKRTRKPLSAHELLVWIQHDWGKPIISLRDIQAYGPNAIRDRETAVAQAEILVEYGWLIPMKAHRRDRIVWTTPPTGARPLPR